MASIQDLVRMAHPETLARLPPWCQGGGGVPPRGLTKGEAGYIITAIKLQLASREQRLRLLVGGREEGAREAWEGRVGGGFAGQGLRGSPWDRLVVACRW
jgi:hypothetical protein